MRSPIREAIGAHGRGELPTVRVHLSAALWAAEDPRPWLVVLDHGIRRGEVLFRAASERFALCYARSVARRRGLNYVPEDGTW